MSIQSISIPTTSTRTPASGKAYTVYHIALGTPVRAWDVQRRYADFESLAREIRAEVGRDVEGEALPGKKVWGLKRSVNDQALIEERRVALETYLRHILSHKNSAYRSSHAFLDFLAAPPLQPGSGGGGGGPPSASSSAANPPSTTAQHPTLPPAPTSFAGSPAWLSEYQTLQALTRTIRASLGRRDELLRGGQTSGGHTAGVVARKDLGLLLARLGVLAGELPGLGQKEKLGTGEMGRRSEMVTALQDDCVRLTKQAAVTPRSARSDAAAAGGGGWDEPDDGARNALLGGARKAKPQGGETDQTRALDDGALMHLQQTQVEDQDAMLRQLSTILQRQKTLGEAISTEINEQNELLDHLSQDVDRTGGKLGRTKRQMNRLN